MQFKTLFALTSFFAAAVAVPNEAREDVAEVADATTSLTTHFTTQTFTASKILKSFITEEPWMTTLTTDTVWTVSRTVTEVAATTA